MGASPLLSLAESQTRVKELLCWSVSQRTQIHDLFLQVFAKWRHDWGLDAPDPTIMTSELTEEQAQRVLAFQLFECASPPSTFGSAYSESSIAESIAEDAWIDWCKRVSAVLGVDLPTNIYGSVVRSQWDGHMKVNVPWWEGTWTIFLNAHTVLQLLAITKVENVVDSVTTSSIVPIQTAIALKPVEVKALFQPITLTLGQIQGLRYGDIVPIDHGLEEPVALVLHLSEAPTEPICYAWLGQRDSQIALELSSQTGFGN